MIIEICKVLFTILYNMLIINSIMHYGLMHYTVCMLEARGLDKSIFDVTEQSLVVGHRLEIIIDHRLASVAAADAIFQL